MRNIFLNFFESNYNSEIRRGEREWISYLLYGLSFALGGFIILFFPEILVALIAMVFFLIGAFIIAIAFQIKRSQNRYHSIKININD